MTQLLTAAQMRAIEKAAIDSGDVTGLELMERAGRGVVKAIFEEWPGLGGRVEVGNGGGAAPKPPGYLAKEERGRRALVLCGPGNNGGDGFVVARLLKERGWEVEVFLYGDSGQLPADARTNYERWGDDGIVQDLLQSQDRLSRIGPMSHLIIDALFGIGLSRSIDAKLRDAIVNMIDGHDHVLKTEGTGRQFVSIDVQSGQCADSGRSLGYKFPADLTVTFHRAKIGHYLGDSQYSPFKKLCVVPIGLNNYFAQPDWLVNRITSGDEAIADISPQLVGASTMRKSSVVNLTQRLRLGKSEVGHKYHHGHALILSGGPGKGGAARLAARGALRIGTGVVTVGCPGAALRENAGALNAIMLGLINDGQGLAKALVDKRINALCLGPGMGTDEKQAGLVAAALGLRETSGSADDRLAVVLDADALTLLSQDTRLFDSLHGRCVLTPHAGEFARLFPDIAEKLNAVASKGPAYSKVDATRQAAARANCIVVFKGPDTVIAAPDGQCSINSARYERSAPWLATAGSGDVLAGYITGLLARSFAPMLAAETAAWLHVECALEFGPGLISEDLPEMLPAVFRKIGA
ncbi:MAG: NAD(P)H-hydrate dehydratase [Paracoccaceae bacterium]